MPEAEGDRYYYADGKKVGLTTSNRFMAVKTPEEGDDRRGATALGIPIEGAQILELPEYDLAVIALPDTGGSSAPAERRFDAVRSAVDAAAEITSGPEVYETTEPGPEALIAIAEIVVKFKEDASEDQRKRLLAKHRLSIKQADYPEPGADLLEVPDDRDPIAIANELHESDLVEFAEPNFVHLTPRPEERGLENGTTATATDTPSLPPELLQVDDDSALADAASSLAGPSAPPTDPGFASQWELKKIKAPEAWDISHGHARHLGRDHRRGLRHGPRGHRLQDARVRRLRRRQQPAPRRRDAPRDEPAPASRARRRTTRSGGVGVAPELPGLPVRIAQGIGGGFWDTTDAKVADGIRKAVDRGADVLSNSYRVGPSTVVTNAFTYAQTSGRGGRGCPIAAATGNSDMLAGHLPGPPVADDPGVPRRQRDQRVGPAQEQDEPRRRELVGLELRAGGRRRRPRRAHLHHATSRAAPATAAVTTSPNFNGTSSATPHVAGLMGLILSVDPDLRSWEVEDIIKLTADDLGPPGGRDQQFGFGRINARRALEAASRIWYQITIGLEFLGAGQGVLHARERAHVQPGHQHGAARRADADVAQPDVDGGDRPLRVPAEPGQRPGSRVRARTSGCNRILLRANGNQSAWSYRWALELELHLLAAGRVRASRSPRWRRPSPRGSPSRHRASAAAATRRSSSRRSRTGRRRGSWRGAIGRRAGGRPAHDRSADA